VTYKVPSWEVEHADVAERDRWQALVEEALSHLRRGETPAQVDREMFYEDPPADRDEYLSWLAQQIVLPPKRWWMTWDENPITWAIDMLAEEGIDIADDREPEDHVSRFEESIHHSMENTCAWWLEETDIESIRYGDRSEQVDKVVLHCLLGTDPRVIRITIEDVGSYPRDVLNALISED